MISATNVSGAVKKVASALAQTRLKHVTVNADQHYSTDGFDMAAVVGNDGQVLKTFHKLLKSDIPVLGVNDSSEKGFLTECGIDSVNEAFDEIASGRFEVQRAERLGVRTDGKELPPALNEVVLVSKRSATLVEYALRINEEHVWRDYSDGVIVATPVGSTAYAMSAGGPMITADSPVFVILSVNSLDVTRRPLVVRNDVDIIIEGLASPRGCEVVVDGTYRALVRNSLKTSRWPSPALVVRLPKRSKTMDTMERKVYVAEELLRMPPSARLVLKMLEYEGPLTPSDISRKTMLPERTARLALSLLAERGLVGRKPVLRDARERLYFVK